MSVILTWLVLTTPATAAAQEADRVQLGIKPVSVDGSYFDLTMEPGESRQLTVELGNFGTRDAVAMTYPADVYSLVNGGMGVRLAGEPTTDATTWIGFEAETLPLQPAEAQLRTFAVSVPEGTAPGEYITSIVIQDATPAASTTTNGVAANRVNRQAIAVAVTVPGPLKPALTLGAVAHHIAGGRSIVTVEVANSGNVRLQPRGELILSDAAGTEQARFPVAMDSVYAGTDTVAEISFSTLLEAGEYSVVLSLADPARTVTETTGQRRLSVPLSTGAASAPDTSASHAASLDRQQAVNDVERASGIGGSTLVAATVATGLLVLGSVVLSRRGTARTTTQPIASSVTSLNAQAGMPMARPATIRQLTVPRRQQSIPAAQPPQQGTPKFRKLGVPESRARLATHARGSQAKGT